MFKNAIVRRPGNNFADGLTTKDDGLPDISEALHQHHAYCELLVTCGLNVEVLPEDLGYPDSTFVEDTAVLVPDHAVLTRPGAPTRQGEVDSMLKTLSGYFDDFHSIGAPGTLDGGDICEVEKHFFVGLSDRTNLEGANQFKEIVKLWGYTVDFIDVTKIAGILHLKSGMSYVGDNHMVLIKVMENYPQFSNYQRIIVDPEENYAANCIRVNEAVITASGYPRLAAALQSKGFSVIPADMSEFRKMDGGLSCLSLRF